MVRTIGRTDGHITDGTPHEAVVTRHNGTVVLNPRGPDAKSWRITQKYVDDWDLPEEWLGQRAWSFGNSKVEVIVESPLKGIYE